MLNQTLKIGSECVERCVQVRQYHNLSFHGRIVNYLPRYAANMMRCLAMMNHCAAATNDRKGTWTWIPKDILVMIAKKSLGNAENVQLFIRQGAKEDYLRVAGFMGRRGASAFRYPPNKDDPDTIEKEKEHSITNMLEKYGVSDVPLDQSTALVEMAEELWEPLLKIRNV